MACPAGTMGPLFPTGESHASWNGKRQCLSGRSNRKRPAHSQTELGAGPGLAGGSAIARASALRSGSVSSVAVPNGRLGCSYLSAIVKNAAMP